MAKRQWWEKPRLRTDEEEDHERRVTWGETLVGVVRGVAEQHHLTLATGLIGGLGMALDFGLWWVYFDFVARRQFKRGRWWPLIWTYLQRNEPPTSAGRELLTFN